MPKETGKKIIAQNKAAYHNYFIEDKYECGISLTGTEVKSLRIGRAAMTDGFAHIQDGEVWMVGIHIPEYVQGTWTNHTPRRERKLLLNRREIDKLIDYTKQGGYTLIPLSMYFLDGRAKVELALAKGKKNYDQRQSLKERQDKREMERGLSRRNSGKD